MYSMLSLPPPTFGARAVPIADALNARRKTLTTAYICIGKGVALCVRGGLLKLTVPQS